MQKKELGYYVTQSINRLELTTLERNVLAHIATMCYCKDGYCSMFNKTLAREHRVTALWISRIVSKLKKMGLIRVEIDKSSGNRRKIFVDGQAQEVTTGVIEPIDLSVPSDIGIAPQTYTYITPVIDINNVLSKEVTREERTRGQPPPLSLSIQKFKKAFPDKPINCDFNDTKFDMDLLIRSIRGSPQFLVKLPKPLSWFVRNYNRVVSGEFKKICTEPHKPSGTRTYANNYMGDKKFTDTNLDEVVL